jgi:hypothetical protein
MQSIILGMFIACGEKTESSTTSDVQTEVTSEDAVQTISVSNPSPSKTSGTIEIKAIVRESDDTTENTSESTESSSTNDDTTTD